MGDRIKLNEIIRELMLDTHDADSYLHGTGETQIIFHTRNAWTELVVTGNMDGNVLSLEIDLQGGWKLPLPEDFIKHVALYGINDDDGILHPLFLDDTIITSGGYLLDNNGHILFDNQGLPLLDRSFSYPAAQANLNQSLVSQTNNQTLNSVWYGRQYNIESGVKTVNGQYKLDRKNKLFTVTESPYTRFVLDYVVDPSHYYNNGIADIEVLKTWKESIKAHSYFNIINKRRSVPMNEKIFAQRLMDKKITTSKLTNAPTIKEYTQWLNRQNGGAVNI